MEFFEVACGTWSHSRVDAELARVQAKSLKCKKAGQASVQRRFGVRSTPVEPTDTEKDKKPSVKKALPIPEDWKPEPFASGRCKQIIEGWSAEMLETQIEKFRAYHRGKGSRWKSWQDAWQTWVLNVPTFGRPTAPPARNFEDVVLERAVAGAPR